MNIKKQIFEAYYSFFLNRIRKQKILFLLKIKNNNKIINTIIFLYVRYNIEKIVNKIKPLFLRDFIFTFTLSGKISIIKSKKIFIDILTYYTPYAIIVLF